MRKSEDYTRLEPFLRAITDQDGLYRITNVAAGSYEIFTSAPGFVNAGGMWAQSVIVGEGRQQFDYQADERSEFDWRCRARKVGPFQPKGFSITRIERDGVVVPAHGFEMVHSTI